MSLQFDGAEDALTGRRRSDGRERRTGVDDEGSLVDSREGPGVKGRMICLFWSGICRLGKGVIGLRTCDAGIDVKACFGVR